MKTKYIINKNELVINIDFLYDIGFKDNNVDSIYKFVNKIIKEEKIKIHGKKILIYVNGIFLGTIYLSSYYLKKFLKKKQSILTNINSYFIPSLILEL